MADVEQFSDTSAAHLAAAADDLLATVVEYVAAARAMRGGSSEFPALFERNEALAAAVSAFNQCVFDHTGTFPLSLASADEDELDEEEDVEPVTEGRVCVVSRWDLQVRDTVALLDAARAVHRLDRPEETERDAEVAVSEVGGALYALTHAYGEPWFGMPGVDVLGGARVYLVPDEQAEPLPDLDDPFDAVTMPAGRSLYSEGWHGVRG